MRVVVIGSGNVAEALVRNVARNEHLELCQVVARNEERGRRLAQLGGVAWCAMDGELADADIYIISVSDRAVEGVASSLCFPEHAVVVHTAGSVPLSAIPERYVHRGIFYAFQTFTAGRDIVLDDVPIFIEAESAETCQYIEAFASHLSREVHHANSERRRVIHLAGVLVNNFVNALYGAGRDVVAEEGLSFDVLKPLIRETALKAMDSSHPQMVQTGPAVRGDMAVVKRHEDMLTGKPCVRDIYHDITKYIIWETSKKI